MHGVGGNEHAAPYIQRAWLESRVSQWLEPGARQRVLVVTGPPGTGKSRLLHEWVGRLRDGNTARLAAAIVRDPRAGEGIDPFEYATIRDGLLAIAPAPPSGPADPTSSARAADPRTSVRMDIDTIAAGGTAVGNFIADVAMRDPADELRESILPRIRQLGPGKPIVVVIDGLDEMPRDDAGDFRNDRGSFSAVVAELTRAIARAPRGDSGLGRLRLLLASQPELPRKLQSLDIDSVDLAAPPRSDKDALTEYARALLAPLNDTDRERLAPQIAAKAQGVWVWAHYVSQGILSDVADGRPAPDAVSTAPGLANVYREAISRIEHRLPDGDQASAYQLLGLVAAAQDVGASGLPIDVTASCLGASTGEVSSLRSALRALVFRDDDGLRFFHRDFGQWLIANGTDRVPLGDAHERLALTLCDLGTRSWSQHGSYVPGYVLPHAVASAECGVDSVECGSKVQRCVSLLVSLERLNADHRGNWLEHVAAVGELCSTTAVLPNTDTRICGLARRLMPVLQRHVGRVLAESFTEAQLDEFDTLVEAGNDAVSIDWLERTNPGYRDVIAVESSALAARVVGGWRPVERHGAAMAELSRSLLRRAERTGSATDLDAAIDAAQAAVDATSDDDEERTARLMLLANGLIDRVRSDGEQPDDLDRLIALQREICRQPGLGPESAPRVRSILARWLSERASRGGPGATADRDDAIETAQVAVDLSSEEDEDRVGWLIRLANGLIERIGTDDEQPDDLDRLITVQREIRTRPKLPAATVPQAHAVSARWLSERASRGGETAAADLDEAIEAAQAAVDATDDDGERTARLMLLANGLIDRVRSDGEQPDDLDRLIAVQREICAAPEASSGGDPQSHSILAAWLLERADRGGETAAADLDESIEATQTAVDSTPDDDEERTRRLMQLVDGLVERVGTDGERPDDLDRLIAVQRAVRGRGGLSPERSAQVDAVLARWLFERARRGGEAAAADRGEAIDAAQAAVDATADDDEERTGRLMQLANGLIARLGTDGEQADDLDRLIAVQRAIRASRGLSSTTEPQVHTILAAWLLERAGRGEGSATADLDEAIAAAQAAVDATPEDDDELATRLTRLANAHWRGHLEGRPTASAASSQEFARRAASCPGFNRARLDRPLRRLIHDTGS